jgi:hypothetical protein
MEAIVADANDPNHHPNGQEDESAGLQATSPSADTRIALL